MEILGFAAVASLWLAFAAALLASEETILEMWSRVGTLPIAARAGAWILFFPWMAAVAAWKAPWLVVWRVLVVAGIAWTTIYAFFPWRTQ